MNYNLEPMTSKISVARQAPAPSKPPVFHLETMPNLLWKAVELTHALVTQLKGQ